MARNRDNIRFWLAEYRITSTKKNNGFYPVGYIRWFVEEAVFQK